MFRISKIAILILVLGCMISCGEDEFTVDCLPDTLQNDVIAMYAFNGGSLEDNSLNSNDLVNTSTATATSDRNGNLSCAYVFNANRMGDEFLTTEKTDFLNGLNSFSISVWYQPLDTTRDNGMYETLVGRGEELRCPSRRGEWSVGLHDCRRAVFGHDHSAWANMISSGDDLCQSEVNALTNDWHHVVTVKDDDNYTLYFNGALQESVTGIANCGALYTAQDRGDFFVGTDFTGKIDDIIIYGRALSLSEVTALYTMDTCCE